MLVTWIAAGLALASGLVIAGPAHAQQTTQLSGIASFYGHNYKGKTASGQLYDGAKFTAAHRTLPFGTRLRVTAPNQRSVIVVVNDRGPFIKGRVLDLSLAAAQELKMVHRGVIKVTAAVE